MKNILTVIFSFLLSITSNAQQTLNGVYGGIKFGVSPLSGGGMSRNDLVIYFRPNGSFNSDWNVANWRSNVSGTYSVSSTSVRLKFNKTGKEQVFTLGTDGNLVGRGFKLFKLSQTSKIPRGTFEYQSANSVNTGNSPYVYAESDRSIYFDSLNKFKFEDSKSASVQGDGIAAGSQSNASSAGTYEIKAGELTLRMENKTIKKRTFFLGKADAVMAAIDGRIYFQTAHGDSNQGDENNNRITPYKNSEHQETKTTNRNEGINLLKKARLFHGGNSIDNISSIKATATMASMSAHSFIDLKNQRIRIEAYQKDKLVSIEQVDALKPEGNWQWVKGQLEALPSDRRNEMLAVFYSGIFGLHSKRIEALREVVVKKSEDGSYLVNYQVNGMHLSYIMDSEGKILVEINGVNKKANIVSYSEFKNVDGVLLPFSETHKEGFLKSTIKYSSYTINPSLGEDVWKKPH